MIRSEIICLPGPEITTCYRQKRMSGTNLIGILHRAGVAQGADRKRRSKPLNWHKRRNSRQETAKNFVSMAYRSDFQNLRLLSNIIKKLHPQNF